MSPISSWKRFLPVPILLLATALVLQARSTKEILPLYRNLSSFPMQVDNWQGTELQVAPDELQILGPGHFLERDYSGSSDGWGVNLFIAFFPTQRTGHAIHSPKNCLPGAGWAPVDSGHIYLQSPGGSPVAINRYLIRKGLDRAIVLYWYQAHGRVTASEYWAKLFLISDAIRMNRTDGALIRVVTPVASDESYDAAQARALGFAERLLPALDDYIPR